MEKSFLEPSEIYHSAVAKGVEKANASLKKLLVLGILGGLYVSLGYIAYIRVAGSLDAAFGNLLGAAIFPLGLICILIAGGELVTGNFMLIPLALYEGKTSLWSMVRNFLIVTIANLIGSLFAAYVLGHLTGLMEGAFLAKTIAVAESKINVGFSEGMFSAMGCTLLVGLAIWMCLGAKDLASKVLVIWFPIASFVAIGFQHLVANMFIIPAAMFAGANITIQEFVINMGMVFIGNLIGAAVIMALPYSILFKKDV